MNTKAEGEQTTVESFLILRIAGLELILAPIRAGVSLLPSHQKFVYPSHGNKVQTPPGAEFELSTENHAIHIQVIDDHEPSGQIRGTPLARTGIWELWQGGDGRYTFVAPRAVPPRRLVVDPVFCHGTIHGAFSAYQDHPGPSQYPLSGLDNVLFINWLASNGDLALHASGVIIDQQGYAFIGFSGAGKSTLAQTLAEDYEAVVLGEDQIALRYLNGRFWIYGTPWHENPKMCTPLKAPLEKLFYLEQSHVQQVTALQPMDNITNILKTAFIPFYRTEFLGGIINRLSTLSELVPCFALSYPLGSDPWPLIERA